MARRSAIEHLPDRLFKYRVDFPALDGCEWHVHTPEGALFLWLWLPQITITSAELYARLKARDEETVRQGIAILGDEVRRWQS